MPKREWLLSCQDILHSINKIILFSSNVSYDELIKNEMIIDAIFRNLEIIGEAVKNIPLAIRKKYSNVLWKEIAGLRDILIHDYFGIDYPIIWDIIHKEIPILKEQIIKILSENNLLQLELN